MRIVTPFAAVVLTMVLGAIVFTLLGYDGLAAVREIFFTPLTNSYKWQDLAVKATPLVIIAVGLSISYRANVWNIGAEGQYVIGAIAGTGVGLADAGYDRPVDLPADAGRRHRRRRGLGGHPGLPAHQAAGQRDPHHA